MKLLFDFFPVIVFFVVFKRYDDPQEGILAATLAIIIATGIQMAVTWWRNRRIEKMHAWTLGLVVFFGGLTLWFEDPLFIKWKPTIVNWLFAVVFAGSQWFTSKPIIQRMLGAQIAMADVAWRQLNMAWVAFFVVAGIANIVVAYGFDTDTWVNFKLFGMLGLTLVFMLIMGVFIARNATEPETEASSEASPAGSSKEPS